MLAFNSVFEIAASLIPYPFKVLATRWSIFLHLSNSWLPTAWCLSHLLKGEINHGQIPTLSED